MKYKDDVNETRWCRTGGDFEYQEFDEVEMTHGEKAIIDLEKKN